MISPEDSTRHETTMEHATNVFDHLVHLGYGRGDSTISEKHEVRLAALNATGQIIQAYVLTQYIKEDENYFN